MSVLQERGPYIGRDGKFTRPVWAEAPKECWVCGQCWPAMPDVQIGPPDEPYLHVVGQLPQQIKNGSRIDRLQHSVLTLLIERMGRWQERDRLFHDATSDWPDADLPSKSIYADTLRDKIPRRLKSGPLTLQEEKDYGIRLTTHAQVKAFNDELRRQGESEAYQAAKKRISRRKARA